MKITGIIIYGWFHHKNLLAIQKGCEKFHIPLKITKNKQELTDPKYNLVLLPSDLYFPNLVNKIVIYGPHVSVFPPQELFNHSIKNSSNIFYNLLSGWVENLWKEFGYPFSNQNIPIIKLPFGVDTDQFKPSEKKNRIFVYQKFRHPSIYEKINNLTITNFEIKVFNYSSYQEQDYLNYIKEAVLGIWIGCTESQGFALQEALSCNVPLIVLNANSMKDEYAPGRGYTYQHLTDKFLLGTTVPFWSEKCGELINDIQELIPAIHKIMNNYTFYEPRKFILENLSIEKTFTELIAFADSSTLH